MFFMMISLIFMFSLIMIFMKHPLSFGMILLLQTSMITLITGLLNQNFWFSYILFLIMVGSMLILFIYMTSIASNEKFKFSNKLFWMIKISLSFLIIMFMIDNFYYDNLMMFETINQNFFITKNLTLNKYLNYPNNMIMYMIIIYLFISLIMVVKITSINHGPLRQKN